MRDESNAAAGGTVHITAGAVLAESKTQPPPTALPVSQHLGGYRIIRPLGKGGMGAVYEAEEIENGRRVALKVLSQALDSPEARQRFLREGLLAASVNHPNTVYVFGTDEIEGQPVIAMELVSGGTLEERVKQKGPMAVGEAVDTILQVIAGLEAAAAVGVLHRDVKPSNCFVETDGAVKVGDFGLSVSTAARAETKLTLTGSFLGTPAFSSPEQLRGDEFTIQGDIYAVGVTLYYLLTGRTPFQGDDLVRMLATVLEKPAESPAQWRPELPKGLCRAVLRCLEKQPAKRFRNYARLRDALLPYGSAAPTPATLGLRWPAFLIDVILLGCAALSVALVWTPYRDAMLHPEVYNSTPLFYIYGGTISVTLKLLYFAVLEGLWGASLGKRICRLRVVGPNRGLPGVPRALLRAVILEFPYILLFVWHSFHLHSAQASSLNVLGLYSCRVIQALLFSTARRRNGFAAVHDLLTRTRVIRKPARAAARPGLEAAAERPAATAAAGQLGPYQVLETLGKSGAEELVLGFDTRLRRKVWIRKLPAGAPPVAPALRDLARVGRLRWLSGQRSSQECWDAYEAVPGKPLADLISRRQPWRRVGFWLLDLAEEINAGLKDQSLPGILELDRVWVTADGRAKLLDFPAPASGARPEQPGRQAVVELPAAGGGSSPHLFLSQVAVSALGGRPVAAADAQPASVAVRLPLHARALLGEMQAGLSPSLLADRLRPLLNGPALVTRARRWRVMVACVVCPFFACLFVDVGFVYMQTRSAQTQFPELPMLRQCLTQLSVLETNRNLPGGLGGTRAAYSANLLGPGLTWNGTPFKFGPSNAADVVAAVGQTIALPARRFTNLALLATAVSGNQKSQVLTVTYADNTSAKWTQSFSDWFTPQNYLRESNALTMAYRDLGDGTKDNRSFHLYGYAFQLDSSKRRVWNLTLPRNADVKVLALTLEPPATTVDLSPFFNQANGIVADGSPFTADNHGLIEAFEVYIAGRFGQAITNSPTLTNSARPFIPPAEETAARQVITRRPAPTEMELRQATAVVEAYLMPLLGPARRSNLPILSNPAVFIALSAWPLVALGAIPSLLMALLFRGGLILRMYGLAVVKKDGTKASRLRVFWRNLIAWFPALLSGPLVALLFMVGRPDGLFNETPLDRVPADVLIGLLLLVNLLSIILTAILVVWSALLPERGLQDRLAGTCLVPRE
jgi:hypothetical protein